MEEVELSSYLPTWIVVYVTFVSGMILFAVFSNSLVIYCMLKVRRLRTVTNILICNLAVSDIMLAGFVMPQRIHDMFHENLNDYYEGEALCKTVNCVPIFAIACSSYTLVCVSFDRYKAICTYNGQQITIRQLALLIPMMWLFALCVSIPTMVQYSVNTFPQIADGVNGSYVRLTVACDSRHMSPVYVTSNAVFLLLVAYLLPMVLMCRNYVAVAIFVRQQARENTARPRQRNVGMFLIGVAAVFAVTWLPFFILLTYAAILRQDTSSDATGFTNLLMIALATISTAYNIVFYAIYNPQLRRTMKYVLRCGRTAEVAPWTTTNVTRRRFSLVQTVQAGTSTRALKPRGPESKF